jgi:hypothetical protein
MSGPPPDHEAARSPLYWFVILEKAVARGDHEAAATAQKELAKLGVVVRYGRPRAERMVAHAS